MFQWLKHVQLPFGMFHLTVTVVSCHAITGTRVVPSPGMSRVSLPFSLVHFSRLSRPSRSLTQITALIYADVLLLSGYEIERSHPVNPPKRFSSAEVIMLRSGKV